MSKLTQAMRAAQRAALGKKSTKGAAKALDKAAAIEAQYPALQMYAPYMAPEEYFGALRGKSPSTIQQLVEVLPKAQEMAAVAKFGAAKKGWYAHSAKALRDVFGDEAPRFAALLASMSPQTSVKENLKNTLAVWEKWKALGAPNDPKQIQQAFVEALGSEQAEGMKAWTGNGTRALAAPLEILTNSGSDRLVLSGPKVDSFMRNLRDEVNAVTNDAWMANYMFGGKAGALREAGLMTGKQVPQKFFAGGMNKAGTDPGIRPGYIAGSALQRRAGDMLGWDPREAQETIWSAVKPGYELAQKLGIPSRELLQRGLLTPDVIRGTPDFSTYLKDDFFRPYLERSGYGEQLDALQPAQWDEALPSLDASEQRYVDRAMGRLDALRKERSKGILSTAGAVGLGALAESDDSEAALKFRVDNPGGEWLANKLRHVQESGTTQYGAPRTFGSTTGYFRDDAGGPSYLELPVDMLSRVPGQAGEQANVRPTSMQWLRDKLGSTPEYPVDEIGAPYIQIAPDGRPWVNEGNHRIMVSKELGRETMPAEVRYFTGGEEAAKGTEWDPAELLRKYGKGATAGVVGLGALGMGSPEATAAELGALAATSPYAGLASLSGEDAYNMATGALAAIPGGPMDIAGILNIPRRYFEGEEDLLPETPGDSAWLQRQMGGDPDEGMSAVGGILSGFGPGVGALRMPKALSTARRRAGVLLEEFEP